MKHALFNEAKQLRLSGAPALRFCDPAAERACWVIARNDPRSF
jgi:hypothetical protein